MQRTRTRHPIVRRLSVAAIAGVVLGAASFAWGAVTVDPAAPVQPLETTAGAVKHDLFTPVNRRCSGSSGSGCELTWTLQSTAPAQQVTMIIRVNGTVQAHRNGFVGIRVTAVIGGNRTVLGPGLYSLRATGSDQDFSGVWRLPSVAAGTVVHVEPLVTVRGEGTGTSTVALKRFLVDVEHLAQPAAS